MMEPEFNVRTVSSVSYCEQCVVILWQLVIVSIKKLQSVTGSSER
jgi:hypothetical protein